MKKLALLSAVAFVGLSAQATAIASNTASGNASATIVAAINVAESTALKFGNVAAGASPGTVVVTTAGIRSNFGGAVLIPGGGEVQGIFDVTGAINANYAVASPDGTTTTTLTGPGPAMTVDAFTTAHNTALDGVGHDLLSVGATLHVAANQTAGSYVGTYPVTVNYN